MATEESLFTVYEEYLSRTNYRETFTIMRMSVQSSHVNFGSVRSCLAIGAGAGEFEIEFIKHCAVNVSKFLAVEPDHESVEHLRTSLKTSLPGVESQVFETTLQNWEGLSDPVDLILIFHSIYYFEEDRWQEWFKRMHDLWLTSGGYVVIVMASRVKSPGNGQLIFEQLGRPVPQLEDVEAYLQKAGFAKLHAYETRKEIDLANPSESLLRFYQYAGRVPTTLDDVRHAMKELYPQGKVDDFDTIAIYKK